MLLVASEKQGKVEPFLDRYEEPVPYPLRSWFPERYRGIGRDSLLLGMRDFGEDLARTAVWDNWWTYFRYREPPADIGSVRSAAYFPLAYDPRAGPDLEGRLIIGRAGGAPGLEDPSGVALDGEGNVYVLDAGNGRIQKFASDGRFLKAVGGPGAAEGEFNQPGRPCRG